MLLRVLDQIRHHSKGEGMDEKLKEEGKVEMNHTFQRECLCLVNLDNVIYF